MTKETRRVVLEIGRLLSDAGRALTVQTETITREQLQRQVELVTSSLAFLDRALAQDRADV